MARRILYLLLTAVIALSFTGALAESFELGDISPESCLLAEKTYPTRIKLKVASNVLGMGAGVNRNNLVAFDILYAGGDGDFKMKLMGSNADTVKIYTDSVTKQTYFSALRPGKVTAWAVVTSQNGGMTNIISNKVKLTVKRTIPVAGLKLDRKTLLIHTSDGAYDLNRLGMTVKPLIADDVRTDGKIPLTWSLSNSAVAQLNGGILTGVQTGKAVLAGRGSGKTVKLALSVVNDGSPYAPTPTPTAKPTPTPTAKPTPTPAPASDSQWRIFIFANSDYYESSGASDLLACGNDVIMMKATYSFASWNGKNELKGYLLENKTGQQMYSLMKQIPDVGIDDDDVTIFYYTGHGAYSDTASRIGALVGVDGSGVTHDAVMNCLDAVPGKVIMYMDSCYSGVYAKETGKVAFNAKGGDPAAFNDIFVNAVKQRSLSKAPSGKYSILTASSATQTSLCRMFGLFTQSLCEGLGGVYDGDESIVKASMKADSNKDGRVSLYEAYVYSKAAVNTLLRGSGESQDVQVWPKNSTLAIYERTR